LDKYLKRLWVLQAMATAFMLFSSVSSQAGEIQYFDESINYWGKEVKTEVKDSPKSNPTINPKPDKKEGAADTAKEEFQWNKYMDPANKEFFKEGEYTPPEPFMELVRNPTDKNIRMWFGYMERKNELASRLQRRMNEYVQANGSSLPVAAKEKIVQASQRLPTPADDFERFRFRMYFDSQCPHCKRMFETLNDLQDRGYFVEARQVDSGPLDQIRSHVAIVPAKTAEVKQYNIAAVPLLLIGDLKTKKVYRQSGFMTPEQILAQIHER
jgi:hypothetical protein